MAVETLCLRLLNLCRGDDILHSKNKKTNKQQQQQQQQQQAL